MNQFVCNTSQTEYDAPGVRPGIVAIPLALVEYFAESTPESHVSLLLVSTKNSQFSNTGSPVSFEPLALRSWYFNTDCDTFW